MEQIRSFIIAVVAALLAAAPLPAAVLLQNSADRRTATIGDRVHLTLTLKRPANVVVEEPAKVDELGAWTVKGVERSQETAGGEVVERLRYTLTAYTTGEHLIPGITLRYRDEKNLLREIKSSPVPVTIESLLGRYGDAADIRDIKPPRALPLPPAAYLAGAALAALIAGGVAWYARSRRRRSAAAAVPPSPPRPPYDAAIEALQALKESPLLKEGLVKEFYVALADILRDYLAAVYGVDTRDKTTAELFAELKAKEPDRKIVVSLRDFFAACDLVKFARYRPDDAACRGDWEAGRALVEIVRPRMNNKAP